MGLGRRFWLVFSGALLMGVLVQAQPMGKPHVRWMAGGVVLGPGRMAFSEDGATLFTLSASDYGLKRWDLDEGRLTKLIRLPSGRTFGGDISNDRRLVAFSSHQGDLSLCRIEDGAVLWSLERIGSAHWLRFSPDDTLLLGLHSHSQLQLWRVADGGLLELSLTDSTGAEMDVYWSEFVEETELIAWGAGEAVRVNAQTGEIVWRQVDLGADLFPGALSPDRMELLAQSSSGVVRVATATGETLETLFVPSTNVTAMAYSPDGTEAAVGLRSGVIEVRDVGTGGLLRTLGGLPAWADYVHTVSWLADGSRLAGACVEGAFVWSSDAEQAPKSLFAMAAHISPTRFASNRQWLLSGGSHRDVAVLDPEDGSVLHRWPVGSNRDARQLCPSPTEDVVLVPMNDGRVEVRTLPEGGVLETIPDAGPVLEFSPDGSRVLAVGAGSVRVMETDDWETVRGLDVFGTPVVRGTVFTPDGGKAVVSFSEETWVIDVETQDAPLVIPAGGALEFGESGEELWTLGREGRLDLWRLSDGVALHGVTIPLTNYSAILSPDRELILTSVDWSEPLQIWSVDTGEKVGELGGEAGIRINYFNPAPDGTWMVATRRDGSKFAFDFPFLLREIGGGDDGMRFRVVGVGGPFELESRPALGSGWESIGEVFEKETLVSTAIGSERYFRARQVAE